MKTYIAILICFCSINCTANPETVLAESSMLFGRWSYTHNDDKNYTFTTYNFVFLPNGECSYTNDIGYCSDGKVKIHKPIFKGTYNYEKAHKKIIIQINGDKKDILNLDIKLLTHQTLKLADENGNVMILSKNTENKE